MVKIFNSYLYRGATPGGGGKQETHQELELQINKWLKENPDIVIKEQLQSSAMAGKGHHGGDPVMESLVITIFYDVHIKVDGGT